MNEQRRRPIRIANCSGFFGDRSNGAAEMVDGGPIDVLTGDWLAELTMLILGRMKARGRSGGYAPTFVNQAEGVLAQCLDRGIKIVSNAGGLDPVACGEALAERAAALGLSPRIACITGDDLLGRLDGLLETGDLGAFHNGADAVPLEKNAAAYETANAYLGCWGIVEALSEGADVVITGRTTDAAIVCGPAAWHHGWHPTDFDSLAGAVVAGHIIECSGQATGGNYSFFSELPDFGTDRFRPRVGFPWAEIAADGSSVIGKHDDTGGAVTVGTVTSQLLYEIGAPDYLGPDVTAHFDSIQLAQLAPDRVAVSGATGSAPPDTLKVSLNRAGGFRNSFSVALTGLDVEHKAELARRTFWDLCPVEPQDFDFVEDVVVDTSHVDPTSQEAATAIWRVAVKDSDERKVGRAFSDAMVQTALSSIPGMYGLGGGPSAAKPFAVFSPALVPRDLVPQYLQFVSGPDADAARRQVVDAVELVTAISSADSGEDARRQSREPTLGASSAGGAQTTLEAPLGTVFGTRSGDKGGDANLGIFARSEAGWKWLDSELTVEEVRRLLPETDELHIDRYRLPNLWSLNFVVRGLLQEGVAASTRQDPQAKALGEWLRARVVQLPSAVLEADPAWT